MDIHLLRATLLHVNENNDIGDLLLDAIGCMLLSALALPDNRATVLFTNGISFYRSAYEGTDVSDFNSQR
jgi:hypothetical protein